MMAVPIPGRAEQDFRTQGAVAQYWQSCRHLAVAAALASVGWQAWNWYQSCNAGEAGALYSRRQQAVEKNEPAGARRPVAR